MNYTTVYVGNQAQIQAQTQTQAQAQSQTQEHGSADIETILEELLGGNIYTTRSCKQYKIEYDSDLEAFTSPDMKKSEYFISIDYLKRYLDSKNPQKQDCPKNS